MTDYQSAQEIIRVSCECLISLVDDRYVNTKGMEEPDLWASALIESLDNIACGVDALIREAGSSRNTG